MGKERMDIYTSEIKIEKQIEKCINTFIQKYNCKEKLLVYVKDSYENKITKTFIDGLKSKGITLIYHERMPQNINVVVQIDYKIKKDKNAKEIRIKPLFI